MLTTRKSLEEFTQYVLCNQSLGLKPADAMGFLFLLAKFVRKKTANWQPAEIPFLGTISRKEDGGLDIECCDDLFK